MSLKQQAERICGKDDNLVTCVFSNSQYFPVLEIWHRYFKRCTDRKCLVIALDNETMELCQERNYDAYLSQYQGDWLGFMRHQMMITRRLLNFGHPTLISDIDAIWLSDPVEFTLSHDSDLVFSPGTFQPPKAHAEWGNVLCTGYFLLRPSPRLNGFLDAVETRMEKEGDQPAINHELLARNLRWTEQDDCYDMKRRRGIIKQSTSSRQGSTNDLSVTLLPNKLFQRLPEETTPLVFHPLARKTCETKLEAFAKHGIL
jgi:hypothetical protein